MNREEFLKQLEMLLSGISEEERSDAMTFYRSYFEDAGEGNEGAIIAELESPQKVADSIKKNLGIDGNGGYYNNFANRDAEYYKNLNATVQNLEGNKKKDGNTVNVVLVVLVAVLGSPIWLTLLACAAALLIAVGSVLFALAVCVVALMAALLVAGVILVGVAFGLMFSGSPAVGIALLGGGLIVLALGLLMILAVIWTFGVFLPWAFKGIWQLCRKPFDKRKERAAA